MIEILVCLIQITVIAIVASIAAKVVLTRSPRLSAQISWLGIFFCSTVVLLTYLDIPRFWNLQPPIQVDCHSAVHSIPSRTDGSTAPKTLATNPPSESLGLPSQDLLPLLSRVQLRNPEFESRLIDGCHLFFLFVLLGCLTRGVTDVFWFWKLRSAEEISEITSVGKELQDLVQQSGIRKRMELRMCESLVSPCVIWVSRNTIYVPAGIEDWTQAERQTAFAHELAHQVRNDPLARFLADICFAAVCFHPLLMILRRQLIFAQEFATDHQAACLLGSRNQYRSGLSRLALRMDSQSGAAYAVSVSANEVIRRIKMLSMTKPSLSGFQEKYITALMVFFSVFVTAWSANADDPVRVASRVERDNQAISNQSLNFNTLPWEELGEQNGYMMLRPDVLAGHRGFKLLYESLTSEMFSEFNFDSVELNPENIELVLTTLIQEVREIPEIEREPDNAQTHRMLVMFDSLIIQTRKPVSWNKIGDQISKWIALNGESEWLKSEFAKSDQKKVMRLIRKETKERTSEHSTALKSVWGQVSRCALAIASATPTGFELRLQNEADVIGARELFSSVDSTAVGIELAPGSQLQQIRFAFAPCEGCTAPELKRLVEETRAKMLTLGRSILSSDPEQFVEAQYQALSQLLDDFEIATIEIVMSAGEREIVVFNMITQANIENLLELESQMIAP